MSLPESKAGKLFSWKEFSFRSLCLCRCGWAPTPAPVPVKIIRLPGWKKAKRFRFFVLPERFCEAFVRVFLFKKILELISGWPCQLNMANASKPERILESGYNPQSWQGQMSSRLTWLALRNTLFGLNSPFVGRKCLLEWTAYSSKPSQKRFPCHSKIVKANDVDFVGFWLIGHLVRLDDVIIN